MTLTLVLGAVLLLAASGIAGAALAGTGRDRLGLAVGSTGAVLACGAGIAAAGVQLAAGTAVEATAAWRLPVGALATGLDPLSSFFLLCVFLVSGLAAWYGAGYLAADIGKRPLGSAILHFNLLVVAMTGVVVARDAVLFLVAWEGMTITSFFLVTYEHEREASRRAGLTYLIASQLGAAALLVMFLLLADRTGSFGFAALGAGPAAGGTATAVFLLAVLGFGTKAGFWPVHVWLPDAHPAAPSHVSAVMSGVMIKMGVYGLLRVLLLLLGAGAPPVWWGALLVAVGALSGVAGMLSALAQVDFKRFLAYSSVENVGIVALGIGVGLLGQSRGVAAMTFLGYAGALLHVLNHGLMKGLLFQGAGSVLHATGTRALDALGGLGRRMPVTAAAVLAGSVAISGLPPFNGFVGEWLILVGAFRGTALGLGSVSAVSAAVLPALALISGLAAAGFVRTFGIAFLGVPRSAAVDRAHESGRAMRVPMLAGAALCLLIGVAPLAAIALVSGAAGQVGGVGFVSGDVTGPLAGITTVAAVLAGAVVIAALARAALLRGRAVRRGPVWACGYAGATARMQYTAESFAEPALAPFAGAVPRAVQAELPQGYFPAAARYEEHSTDMAGERVLVPGVRRVVGLLGRLRILQQGRMQLYLAYVMVTLLALLVWQVGAVR